MHNAEAVDTASLSLAMFSALRFQQLASGLEVAYRATVQEPEYAMDWVAWDEGWQARDLKAIAPVAFWYWIQLRVKGDQPKKNQAQLRDAEALYGLLKDEMSEILAKLQILHPKAAAALAQELRS